MNVESQKETQSLVYVVWENYFDECEFWKTMKSIHSSSDSAHLEETSLELEHLKSKNGRSMDYWVEIVVLQP
jgi:hypothetical protein